MGLVGGRGVKSYGSGYETVTGPCGDDKVGNFWSRWATIRFPRSILLTYLLHRAESYLRSWFCG